MSTSTYTPTFLSVRNWPEITWWIINHPFTITILAKKCNVHNAALCSDLNFDSVGNNPIHYVFRERVKVLVRPPHELGFQQVAAAPVVLKHTHVELHGEV